MDDRVFMIVVVLGFSLVIYFTLFLLAMFKNKKINTTHVNQDSFQKYAKFFGETIPSDGKFDEKLNKIYDLIKNKKVYDVKVIAEKSCCNVTECVLKIKYLKNKRLIGDLYIDTVNNLLVPCSDEDQKLIEKYQVYIYNSHLQINEIAGVISNPNRLSPKELYDTIFKELNYLDEKGLLNGLKIDDVDGTITYYSIEKRKNNSDLRTVHCSNCGALNDVQSDGKGRCLYCNNIIVGKDYIE